MAEERNSEYANTPGELVAEMVIGSQNRQDRRLSVQGGELRIIAGNATKEFAWAKIRKVFERYRDDGRDNVQSTKAALNNPELSFAELVIGLKERPREMQLKMPDSVIRIALASKALALGQAMETRYEKMRWGISVEEDDTIGRLRMQDLRTGAASLRKFRDQLYQKRDNGMSPAARR